MSDISHGNSSRGAGPWQWTNEQLADLTGVRVRSWPQRYPTVGYRSRIHQLGSANVRKEGRQVGGVDPLARNDVRSEAADTGPIHEAPRIGDSVPPARYVVLGDPRGRTRPIRSAIDPEAERRYPALWEYLTCCLIDDKGREPATLIVCCEEGQVKFCLSDRETNRVLWRSGDTVLEALEAMEKALRDGARDWRERREYKRK